MVPASYLTQQVSETASDSIKTVFRIGGKSPIQSIINDKTLGFAYRGCGGSANGLFHVRAVFIVGAQKAGTTFLHNLLAAQPEFVSRPDKEPHYFSSDLFEGQAFEDIFLPKESAEFLLDSSASYLHVDGTAERIAEAVRDPLIVILKRDPLRRAISGYLHNAKNGRELRSMREALSLTSCDYADVRAEETEAIERALACGTAVLRPSYETHFGDKAYTDPLWTFRYVTNSFTKDQTAPFRKHFVNVAELDFDNLVREPILSVNAVRRRLGLELLDTLERDVATNPTVINRRKVVRKYLRNLHRQEDGWPAPLHCHATSLLGALFTDFGTAAREEVPVDLPWIAAASETHKGVAA